MLKVLSIMIGKISIFVLKLLKRGSSTPGTIALKIDKNLMDKFTLPKTVIAVTGSSGKGSISSMLASVCRSSNLTVAHNIMGSNLTPGIVTLLLENSTLTGKIKKDVLIYEIDERYTKYVFKSIKPSIVVISNITRDQPPRQGHFDTVFNAIDSALTSDMHLILNGDDPYTRKFTFNHNCKVTYYGIDKNKYSYKVNKFENLNLNYCPKCGSRLEYNYYNFENTGDYYCTKCDFKRPKLHTTCNLIDYNKNELIINNKYHMTVPANILYTMYNCMATLEASISMGLDIDNVVEIISKISKNKKLLDTFNYKNRNVVVLNNKNENSSTFNQSLLYVTREKKQRTIVIGWKEISRRYNFDDLSWLYDIDFELLNKIDIEKVVCVGIHRYDIATRLKLAGIKESKIIVFDNLVDATNYIKNKTKSDICGILNFDYVKPFKELMEEV